MSLQSNRLPVNHYQETLSSGYDLIGPSLEKRHGGEQSLRDAIRTLRKRKVLIGLCVAVAFLLSLLVCIVMTPQYTSTATVLVDKQEGIDLGNLSGLASAVGGGDDAKTEIETHISLIESPSTALEVASELDLPKIAPFRAKPSIFHREKPPIDSAVLQTDPKVQEAFLQIFSKHLKVETKEDTRLILVHVLNPDPYESAKIANTIVNVYIRQYLQTRFKATAQASNWLSDQLGDLKKNVEASQQKLIDYERKTGLSGVLLGASSSTLPSGGGSGGLSLSSSPRIPDVDKLALLNQELTEAEANRIQKEAIYRLTQTNSPDVVIGLANSPLTSSTNSAVLTDGNGLSVLNVLRQQQAALQVDYASAASKYGSHNPRLIEMQQQVHALDDQVSKELERINERAKSDFQLAQRTEDGLRQSYKNQQGQVDKINDSATQLEVLAGEAASSRALYEELFTRLQEANIQAGVKATNINLVDPARAAATPTRPNWRLYPLLGIAAGFFFGLGAAFTLENLDDVLTTPDQLLGVTHLPVLAAIPVSRNSPGKAIAGHQSSAHVEPSLLITKPNDPIAESYRGLRTSIQMSGATDAMRTLLVTSPLGGDGKTTVCYNLAVAFAQQGKRVLLIDADMRKARMHHLMKISKMPGLSDVLATGLDWRDAAKRHSEISNLSFIPAGTTPPMPAELLSLPRFDQLLDELSQHFDLVLIDSPPVLLVTDALILSTKVYGTIVVVRSGVTSRTVFSRALEGLARSDGRKIGIVLNSINTSSVEYYYSYGYYGKDKYYEEEGVSS
jgi:polysaccharide biosynthesis transport protein